ncbi:phospholipid transport system transporter-binding protein [Gammaproteobacteria bacterium]
MKTVHIEPQGSGCYLFSGELSFATVPVAWARTEELFAGPASLVLDLAGITRSDSAALILLLGWIRLARRRGKEIGYRNLPAQLLAVAKVSGVENLLPRG